MSHNYTFINDCESVRKSVEICNLIVELSRNKGEIRGPKKNEFSLPGHCAKLQSFISGIKSFFEMVK